MSKTVDLAGKQFGELQVVKRAENSKNNKAQWLCRCKCEAETIVRADHLKSGAIKSCGCDKNIKHGMSKTRLYYIWNGMIQRCNFPHRKDYPCYGAKGISVCEAWKNDFMAFREWALSHGYAENLTIDRKDGNGNYEPSNCRWTDIKEQAFNRNPTRQYEYMGETLCIRDLAKKLDLPFTTAYRKLNEGLSAEELAEYAQSRSRKWRENLWK